MGHIHNKMRVNPEPFNYCGLKPDAAHMTRPATAELNSRAPLLKLQMGLGFGLLCRRAAGNASVVSQCEPRARPEDGRYICCCYTVNHFRQRLRPRKTREELITAALNLKLQNRPFYSFLVFDAFSWKKKNPLNFCKMWSNVQHL